jgi:hypothetical protein
MGPGGRRVVAIDRPCSGRAPSTVFREAPPPPRSRRARGSNGRSLGLSSAAPSAGRFDTTHYNVTSRPQRSPTGPRTTPNDRLMTKSRTNAVWCPPDRLAVPPVTSVFAPVLLCRRGESNPKPTGPGPRRVLGGRHLSDSRQGPVSRRAAPGPGALMRPGQPGGRRSVRPDVAGRLLQIDRVCAYGRRVIPARRVSGWRTDPRRRHKDLLAPSGCGHLLRWIDVDAVGEGSRSCWWS